MRTNVPRRSGLFYFALGAFALLGVLIFWLWRANALDEDERQQRRPWR